MGLDLPIPSGSTASDALRNSIDLARQAERLGYTRYWFAEHHLNPGVAGSSPAVVLALTAAATSTIRIGSGAVQMGHRTALSVVEEFGLIDALHPGRLDLGLGRSLGRHPGQASPRRPSGGGGGPAGAARPRAAARRSAPRQPTAARRRLLIPPRSPPAGLLKSPRFALQRGLLQLPNAEPQNYTEQVGDILALLRGTYRVGGRHRGAARFPARTPPCRCGSSAAAAARAPRWPAATGCGSRPTTTSARPPCSRRPKATGPRSGRRPSWTGPTSASRPTSWWPRTRRPRASWPAATGCGCAASGPARARSSSRRRSRPPRTSGPRRTGPWSPTGWTPSSSGRPGQVADQLERLRDATGADELIVTTITHQHADRVRSYELLAEEWARR